MRDEIDAAGDQSRAPACLERSEVGLLVAGLGPISCLVMHSWGVQVLEGEALHCGEVRLLSRVACGQKWLGEAGLVDRSS